MSADYTFHAFIIVYGIYLNLNRAIAVVFLLGILYIETVLKLSLGFFNGQLGQIRKGLSTTRVAFEFNKSSLKFLRFSLIRLRRNVRVDFFGGAVKSC